jgi:ribose transport system substrate-binding protein
LEGVGILKKRGIIPFVFTAFLLVFISLVIWFLKEDNKPKVIFVGQRLDTEYWKIIESGAKEGFRDFDIEGEVLAPDSVYPISNQPNLLKTVLKQHPDALIVTPTVPADTIPVLEEFKKNNIPVIFASRDIEWEHKTSYIGTDHYALGKTAGKLLGSMVYPGEQVAIIYGGQDDQAMIDRKNGMKKVLEDIGIEIVTEQSGYDQFGNPKPVIGAILQKHPDIQGIVTTSDRLALDALKTLEKKEVNIPVIGTDGITDMVESIEAGKMNATIAQNPYDIGYLSVEQAKKAIDGAKTEKRIDSGIDIITEGNANERLNFIQKLLD